jgi:hypothetical protein
MPFFLGFLLNVDHTEWYGPEPYHLFATGSMHATLPVNAEADRQTLTRLGLKVGLLIGRRQRVEDLRIAGVPYAPDTEVTNDLATVFGTPRLQQWAGLISRQPPAAKYPVSNVVQYGVELRLSGVRQLPQLVPFVVRYANDFSFAASHLAGLWVLPPPERRVPDRPARAQ